MNELLKNSTRDFPLAGPGKRRIDQKARLCDQAGGNPIVKPEFGKIEKAFPV